MNKIKNEAIIVEKAVMNEWHRFLHRVITILKSKYTELFIGAAMFTSACFEIYEAFQHADKHMGAKHGVALMGVLMMIRCVAELLHGAEMMESAEERTKEKAEFDKMSQALAELKSKTQRLSVLPTVKSKTPRGQTDKKPIGKKSGKKPGQNAK
jgi:hypothetical protein